MKILYISRGGLTHTFTYINYFLERGHTVYLYALTPVGEQHRIDYENKIQIISPITNDIANDYLIKKLIFIKSYLLIPKYLKKIKPDVVHIHYLTSGGIASFFFNHPNTFLTIHGSDILLRKSWFWRRIQISILKKIRTITVVSKEIEEKVNSLGKFSNKMILLPVGIDTIFFTYDSARNCGQLKIIATRRLEYIYNYPTIIHALAILKEKGISFQLTIVGYGSKEKELKQLVSLLSLSDSISFVGKKSIGEISNLLKDNCVYISASFSDGTSLSLLEALSSGLYPIVSEINANKYWIEKGEGLMFDPLSPQDLADKLELFWLKRDLFFRKIDKNIKLVNLEGNLNNNMEKLELLYSKNLTEE